MSELKTREKILWVLGWMAFGFVSIQHLTGDAYFGLLSAGILGIVNFSMVFEIEKWGA